ncbi:UNKNOWN [Stylonychia lemnae]|uniref:Sfi1 spindle body domain-containing protein n=1 Tax=Stylonychia lemnae TaxID=5949 RepID=A0A078A8S4_STYLE|nr:UNKNOWN [Stylonychia lemnae]|eukprot:CDW77942.1 UNKNOWN [Stylonychia lemnae]
MSITPTHVPKPLRLKQTNQNKENLQFKAFYSTKDFAVIQKIITKAEKSKQIQKKRCQSASSSISLSDIIEAYKKVMMKMNIEILNETHYYAMIIKLSLNQHGKTWRECLQYEMKQYKTMTIKKYFCRWIEKYIQTYREQENRSMINSQNHSQMIKLESERQLMSTIKQQLTPLSQNSALFDISSQNRSHPQLFTNNVLQETEFLKNIINLSGQSQFIKMKPDYQRNSQLGHLLDQNTTAKNALLTTAMTPQLSKQDLKITYEPTQTELRSLERNYQKRKKENALVTMGKFMMKQLKFYSFANSDPSIHLQKAYRRWNYHSQIMTQLIVKKELFINKWMKAYEHYNFKAQKKVFKGILETGAKLKVVQQIELQVRDNFESRLTNLIFFQWVEKFNRRVQYRNNLFKATQCWAKNSQSKHLALWKCFVGQQKDTKMKFRNFQMINIVKTFLQNGVPRKLYKDQQTFGDQFQTLVVIRKLKSLDQVEFDQTIYLYVNDEEMLQNDSFMERLYLKQNLDEGKARWQGYSHQQLTLKQRMFCFQKKNSYKIIDKVMASLFKNYRHRTISFKNNTTAKLFHNQNLYVKTLVSLEHNRRLQKAQRLFLNSKMHHLVIFYKRRILYSLSNLAQKRKQNRALETYLYEQKSKTLDLLRNGVQIQKYLQRCNKKGQQLYKKNLKQRFIVFLRESLYEIEMRKQLYSQLLEESYYARMARLFRGFIVNRQQKIIRREQTEICKQISNENKKRLSLNILRYSTNQNQQIRQKICNYEQNLKYEMFQYLKYSVQKVQQLRESYYDYIVDKSRLKATLMLVHWQNKTIQRSFRRQTLNQRIEYFQKHRFFRNYNRLKTIKGYYEQKLQIFELFQLKRKQYSVIQGILQYINSDSHLNDKKAKHHNRQILIIKAFAILKRQRDIRRIGIFIEASLLQDKLRKFYNIWQASYLNSQANQEARQYLQSKKQRRLFKAWKNTAQTSQKQRLNKSLAAYQYENGLKYRFINLLRHNIEINRNQQHELQMLDVKAYWFKLMKLFNEWKQQTYDKKILQQKQFTLEMYLKQKMVSVYYQNMRKAFRYQLILKNHYQNQDVTILRKYFKILKHGYKSTKIGNYLSQESDMHHSKTLVQKSYQSLLSYARYKKQRKIKSLQSSIWHFKRMIHAFLEQLRFEVQHKQTLSEKQHLVKYSKNETLVRKTFAFWLKEQRFQVNQRNAKLYRKKKSFSKFRSQLSIKKVEKEARQMKELEVIELLAYKLQKRAFYGFRMYKKFLTYKNGLEGLKLQYQARKWFDVWRTNYLHKGEFNYLNLGGGDGNYQNYNNDQTMNVSRY